MIAHIYARVSTDAQAEKGYSLQTQVEACRKTAEELGATYIVEHVDDGYSGGEIDRPGMNGLRAALENKDVDLVICYDPDRLARNLAHQLIITEEIEKAGARLVFVSVTFEDSPEGKLFYSIRGAISAYEKEKIRERVIRGKRGKAQSGKIVQNAKPTGYGWDAEKSIYVPNEDSALVRRLFDMALSGMSTISIAQTLNQTDVPSPREKKWHAETIRRILRNPLYYGKAIQYREQVSTINRKRVVTLRDESEWSIVHCQPIVSKEVFDKVQLCLAKQRKFAARNEKSVYLLRGLLYCAKCGCKLKIAKCGRKGDKKYYRCSSTDRNREFNEQIDCTNRGIQTDRLDEYVWDMLVNLVNQPDKIRALLENNSSPREYKKRFENLKKAEESLVAERNTLMRWVREKLVSLSDAERQLKEIKKQQDSLADQLAQLNNYRLQSKNVDDKVQLFIDTIGGANDRREACIKLIDKIYYERHDEQRGRLSNPDITVRLVLS